MASGLNLLRASLSGVQPGLQLLLQGNFWCAADSLDGPEIRVHTMNSSEDHHAASDAAARITTLPLRKSSRLLLCNHQYDVLSARGRSMGAQLQQPAPPLCDSSRLLSPHSTFQCICLPCAGQWVPSCSSLGSMQLLHNTAATCCTAVNQQVGKCLLTLHAQRALL